MNPALETLILALAGDEGRTNPCPALFLGAEPHPEWRGWPDLTGWQPHKPLADAWQRAGFHHEAGPPAGKWPLVMVLPGKSRDETLAWFALARACLKPGGRILAAMPNTTGAARFEKELAKATRRISSIQKHKCRAFLAVDDGSWDEDLFLTWLESGKPRAIPGTGFITQAGVFSSGHIDPGSRFLASHLPAGLHGHVADLGAAWGFLSDAALRHCPRITKLELFEADSRALACARENLARHTRDIRFHWHDVTTGLPTSPLDAVLMNPPFHNGRAADVELGRAFITRAAESLRRGGRLLLVANRQLPYEAMLDDLHMAWRKPAENATYKLLFAEKR